MLRKRNLGVLMALAIIIAFGFTACDELDGLLSGITPDDYGNLGVLEFELNEEKTGFIVSGGTVTTGAVVIPPAYPYNGELLPVVEIADYAFRDPEKPMATITSVTIPSSVKIIGEYAFALQSITSITLNEGLEIIRSSAFAGTKITSIKLPETLHTIRREVFDWCKQLTSIRIPANVSYMGTLVFNHCDVLTTIYVDRGSEDGWDINWTGNCTADVIF